MEVAVSERVISHEKTNARYLTAEQIPERFTYLFAMRASLAFGQSYPLMELVSPGGQMIILIKPQFEVVREHVGKRRGE